MNYANDLLIDLNRLVLNSIARYNSEFIWQDVKVTDEFKFAFASRISRTGSTVRFYEYSSIVTTGKNKKVVIPNQWYVIASYVGRLCSELEKYQSYFFKVADVLYQDYGDFAKFLRSGQSTQDQKENFLTTASHIFLDEIDCSQEAANTAADRLWKFCTDYKWWGGSKTVDRGDFKHSTILSTLNLVANSQGYVADIVDYYISDDTLSELTSDVLNFTIDLQINICDAESIDAIESSNITPTSEELEANTELANTPNSNSAANAAQATSTSEVHKIKISSTSFGKFNEKK